MKLNPKQEKFIIEYMKDQNGTQAAIRAGYSKHTANEQAAQLLAKLSIRSKIDDLMGNAAKAAGVDAEYVIRGLKEVAERCMQRTPVMVFDYTQKRLVQKMEENEQGKSAGVWEFDSTGANKALELLGKHLDLFKGNDNQPVKVVVEIKQVP